MSVRAKFKVDNVSFMPSGRIKDGKWEPVLSRTIQMSAVGNSENSEAQEFWTATPYGDIKMSIANPVAAEEFEIDGEYYVEFIQVKRGQRVILQSPPE